MLMICSRLFLAIVIFCLATTVLGHGVADGDRAFIEQNSGLNIVPFVYLGAKHMVTGYDHLLFLFGVIFFLYRMKDIGIYVTLFALGHSATLLFGVLSETNVNPYAIDAIIGLSVVYKAFDNIGGFKKILGFQPNTKIAVFVFGLFHGFGLATKLQDFTLSQQGLVGNIVSFNVGVEIGQFVALGLILLAVSYWRLSDTYLRQAFNTNIALMTAGFILTGYQLVGLAVAY